MMEILNARPLKDVKVIVFAILPIYDCGNKNLFREMHQPQRSTEYSPKSQKVGVYHKCVSLLLTQTTSPMN